MSVVKVDVARKTVLDSASMSLRGWSIRTCAIVIVGVSTRVAAAQPRVEIDVAQDRGAVNRLVYGGNLEFIGQNTPEVATLAGGLPLWRFPGGDADGAFRWDATMSLAPLCSRPGGWTWDLAANLAVRQRVSMLLETNLSQTNAANVADWVADARRRGVTVAWVGIGNEVWGDWDASYRPAARYAQDVREHATAIRARVPGTRVALSIGTSNEDTWNREALRRTADVIDAVDYHFYPNHREWGATTPAEVMAGAEAVGPLVGRLRAMIRAEAPARAEAIQVLFGEWDGAADAPFPMAERVTPRAYAIWSMSDAIFYGSALGEMLTAGVGAAMFYEVQGYRFGAIPGNVCYTADLRVRRPKVLVHQLYREHFGDRLVAVTPRSVPTYRSEGPTNWDGYAGDVPYVRVYASTAEGGRSLRVVVVNRGGATKVASLTLDVRNFVPAARATVWEVGGGAATDTNENVGGPHDAVQIRMREVAVPSAAFAFAPAPYSVAVIELRARETTNMDGGAPDGSTASPDAETPDVSARKDVQSDLGANDDVPAPPGSAPSCKCSTAERANGLKEAVPYAALALLAGMKRRKRRSTTAP